MENLYLLGNNYLLVEIKLYLKKIYIYLDETNDYTKSQFYIINNILNKKINYNIIFIESFKLISRLFLYTSVVIMLNKIIFYMCNTDFTVPLLISILIAEEIKRIVRRLERAILAPTNEIIDMVNEHILSLFPGEERTYLSLDSINYIYYALN